MDNRVTVHDTDESESNDAFYYKVELSPVPERDLSEIVGFLEKCGYMKYLQCVRGIR